MSCERQKYYWELLNSFKYSAKHLIDLGESMESLKSFLDFELELKLKTIKLDRDD